MIEIFKPIIIDNCIKYPININDKLYHFNIIYTNYSGKLNRNIDGIVIMMISIAICNKWKIKSRYPIDAILYDNLLNIPNIYKKYYDKHNYLLNHIKKEDLELILDIPKINRNKNITNIKITPISLGVDSLYTILSNINDITHLLYIKDLDASCKIKNYEKNLETFSKKYNKKLIIAHSNFKKIFSELKIYGTNYGVFTSDIILTGSLYPLSPECIYFSGYGKDIPCIGAQLNEINQYFKSNEFDSICRDILRVKKIKFILEKDPEILYILRVCNDEIDNIEIKQKIVNNNIYYTGIFNCGNCGKCTRTYSYLYMLNYHDKIKTFNNYDGNYIDYYTENNHNKNNKNNKALASKYYDMIFENILKIYRDNNNSLDNIEKYDLIFKNEENIIIPL